MEPQTVVRSQAIVDQILDILSKRIKDHSYPPGAKLPSENSLCEEFDVSRVTVRRAMDVLVSKGSIYRVQGVGSFVSAISQITDPIVDPILFQELIRNQGYEPGIHFIHARLIRVSHELADRLKIEEGEEIVELQKVFTADGEPVIFCSNTIPNWVLKGHLVEKVLETPAITEPIFDFLANECGEPLSFYLSSLYLDDMKNSPVILKDYPPSAPALVIDEIGYNSQEKPIMLSIHFYPGSHIKFEVVRRRNLF